MYHVCHLPPVTELWIQKQDSYLPVHELLLLMSEKYHRDMSVLAGALMNAYVLTGCDSVSNLYHRGKRKAAKLALQQADTFTHMAEFGTNADSLTVTENVVSEGRDFIVGLYVNEKFGDLNLL